MGAVARKIKICTELDCQNAQTTQDYCRLHYLKNWRELKEKQKKKDDKKLNRYVEGIMKRNREAPASRSQSEEGVAPTPSASEEVNRLIEDLGYADPQSVDHLIENLKVDKDY